MDTKEIVQNVKDQIKDLLKMGPRHYVGVDIGLNSVKIAEVKHTKDKIKLMKFEWEPLPEGALIEDEIQKPEEIIEALEKCIERGKFDAQYMVLGLFGPNVVSKRLQLAGGSDEEIEDQVHWEGEQYFPFSMDECSFGFQVYGENEGGGVDVIVGAGKNDVVLSFKDMVEKTNLKLKVADLNCFAVSNVFELVNREKIEESEETFLLLDIGAQKISFIIYKKGGVSFSKEIPLGGVIITEEIQRQMGVNYSEAEDLKKSGEDNVPEEILDIIDEIVESFFSEIKKTLDFFISSTGEEELKSCYVTGGSSLIPNLLEGLGGLLEIEVELLDPFLEIDWNEKNITKDKIEYIKYNGVSAIGLAMRTPKE